MILEVNESGELIAPAELVQAAPHTRFEAERQGESLVLKLAPPPAEPRFHLEEFPTFPGGPTDPSMTFRREDIYNDDGR